MIVHHPDGVAARKSVLVAIPARVEVAVEGDTDLQTWFGGSRSIELREDVIGLGRYGKTLTVLHDIELPDEQDDEYDETVTEPWTERYCR